MENKSDSRTSLCRQEHLHWLVLGRPSLSFHWKKWRRNGNQVEMQERCMQVLTCAMQTERAAKQTNALDVSRIVPLAILPSPKGLRIRADNNQDMLTQNREQILELRVWT